MTSIKVTIEHPGAHEPNGDTFASDFAKTLTEALRTEGLKRGEGDHKIVGYSQTSGQSTTYDVELDTEKAKAGPKPAAPKVDPEPEVKPDPVVVTTTEAAKKF